MTDPFTSAKGKLHSYWGAIHLPSRVGVSDCRSLVYYNDGGEEEEEE